jgi:hypothetical protein
MRQYPKAKNVKFGQMFTKSNDETYILAQVGPSFQAALISLSSGNRWKDAVMIDGYNDFSNENVENIFRCNKNDYWKRIKN